MLPPAIIFINSDINLDPDGYTQATLTSQLYINEVITFSEFNLRLTADPNYQQIIHLQRYRILVLLSDFTDHTNRDKADMVLFYSHGQVTVIKNNYGPPSISLPISRINIYELLRDVGSSFVAILPVTATKPPTSLKGIVALQGADSSGVHDINTDNIYTNTDFINRK